MLSPTGWGLGQGWGWRGGGHPTPAEFQGFSGGLLGCGPAGLLPGSRPSHGPQLQHPGQRLLGAGIDQVGTGRRAEGLPVPAAEGREAVHRHETFVPLPPAGETLSARGQGSGRQTVPLLALPPHPFPIPTRPPPASLPRHVSPHPTPHWFQSWGAGPGGASPSCRQGARLEGECAVRDPAAARGHPGFHPCPECPWDGGWGEVLAGPVGQLLTPGAGVDSEALGHPWPVR